MSADDDPRDLDSATRADELLDDDAADRRYLARVAASRRQLVSESPSLSLFAAGDCP